MPKKWANLIQDITPVVQEVTPDNDIPNPVPAATILPVKNPGLNYHSARFLGRGQFIDAEYNLSEIGRIEDTDSYVRQAFNKKVALMFKEGWDLVGSNPKTIRYIRQRLIQIAQASTTPSLQLLREIGSGLVRKSNVFILKVRNTDSSGGRVRNLPGSQSEIKPVAAYFLLPAETMQFQLEGNKVVLWRQKMPDGTYKDYNPKDIIHFHYDRKEGFVFGTPTLIPVVDDIRALRKIEENIELLVYQHLFPIFQWKVGTPEAPAGITEGGEREVDIIRREIQFMPSEGGLVTTERHEIRAIGAEGRALKADGYLSHFKNRVISGLGISAVDLGEGNTANRATADNMSRNLIDSVKDFQQVMELFVNEFIINELLLESTFGEQVLETENRVWIKFKEIDIDAQIKKEAHMADQFAKDLVTHDEARIKIGYEPIQVPTGEEGASEEYLEQKYPAWYKTRFKLFAEPLALIQSMDEPYSPAAVAASENRATDVTPGQNETAGEAKTQSEKDIAVAKEKAKPRPIVRNSLKDSVLSSQYNSLKSELPIYAKGLDKLDHDWMGQIVRASLEPVIPKLQSQAMIAFGNGYGKYGNTRSINFSNTMRFARTSVNSRVNKYVTRLINDTVSSLKRNVKDLSEIHAQSHSVFDTLKFRSDFIEDVEVRKAQNYGTVLGLRDTGHTVGYLSVPKSECQMCNAAGPTINLLDATLDDVPPYHANCNCTVLKDRPPVEVKIQNSVESAEIQVTPNDGKETERIAREKGDVVDCPYCGTSSMRRSGTTNYNCGNCRKAFDRSDLGDRSNEYEFLSCIYKTRARLFQRHPDWDENQLMIEAEAACVSKLVDYLKNDLLTDNAKLEFLRLKERVSLRKRHPEWKEDKVKETASSIVDIKFRRGLNG